MSLSNEVARYELNDILERLNGTALAAQPDTAAGLANRSQITFSTTSGSLENFMTTRGALEL